MSKMCKVMYLLNEEGRKKSLLGGGDGNRNQIIYTPITKELLDIASVDNAGEAIVKIGYRDSGNNLYESSKVKISTEIKEERNRHYHIYEPVIKDITKVIEFNKPQTVEELLTFEKNRALEYEKSLKENEEKIKPLLLRFEEEMNTLIEKEENLKKEKEEKQIQEKLKREAEHKDDLDWIENEGSDYLKQCVKLGYNCRRKYIEERVKKEFPDFCLDFDDYANWKERVSPSQKALDEVVKWLDKGFDAKIVWLTNSVYGDEYDYENDFEPCEAIALKFKGYWLVREI